MEMGGVNLGEWLYLLSDRVEYGMQTLSTYWNTN